VIDDDGYGPEDLAAELNVSRETLMRLQKFRALLNDWSTKINLIGPKELGRFWRRHAFDSAQLLSVAPDAVRWIDAGAGAGFPGIVIACGLAGRPDAEVVLVESIAKKCGFLQAAIDALEIPARVENARVETLRPFQVDVFTARALADLPTLMTYARPYLDRGAIGLFPRGERAEEELTSIANSKKLRCQLIQSRSDPRGRIVKVEALRD
jgi:16S rRNA (guanine527-N7)-methyltransferase